MGFDEEGSSAGLVEVGSDVAFDVSGDNGGAVCPWLVAVDETLVDRLLRNCIRRAKVDGIRIVRAVIIKEEYFALRIIRIIAIITYWLNS